MTWLERIAPVVHFFWHGSWHKGFTEAPRLLYGHELVIFTEGWCRMVIGDQEHLFGPGDYVIVPPATRHKSAAISDEPVYRYCLHFDWAYQGETGTSPLWVYLPEALERRQIHPTPDFVPSGLLHGSVRLNPDILALLRRLAFRWSSTHPADHLICRAIAMELLFLLLSEESASVATRPHESRLAMQIKHRLDECAHSNGRQVSSALQSLPFRYEHLCRVFKKHFRVSPKTYILLSKMEIAKNLLKDPTKTVSEVSDTLGFGDPSHFSRLFKKYVGTSPRDY